MRRTRLILMVRYDTAVIRPLIDSCKAWLILDLSYPVQQSEKSAIELFQKGININVWDTRDKVSLATFISTVSLPVVSGGAPLVVRLWWCASGGAPLRLVLSSRPKVSSRARFDRPPVAAVSTKKRDKLVPESRASSHAVDTRVRSSATQLSASPEKPGGSGRRSRVSTGSAASVFDVMSV
jgi:hypothetical protein